MAEAIALAQRIGDGGKAASVGEDRRLPAVPAECPHRADRLTMDARALRLERAGIAVNGQLAVCAE